MGGSSSSNLALIIGLVAGGVIIVIVVILLILRLRKKPEVKPVQIDTNEWVKALGGNENIISLESKGSRLIVKLNKYELINKDELHNLGVLSVISSQDKITLVLKEKAENICNLLQ